jgi:predicted metal-dependent peptidase
MQPVPKGARQAAASMTAAERAAATTAVLDIAKQAGAKIIDPFGNELTELDAGKLLKSAAAAIDKAQMRAVFDQSAARAFFTQLTMSLDVKPAWGIPTAAVDGKCIYYNPAFINTLSADEVHGVMIGHEPNHCHSLHLTRLRTAFAEDHRTANEAADLEVNQLCREAGFVLPKSAIFPGEKGYKDCPPGLTAEEYYRILRQRPRREEEEGGEGGGEGDDSGPDLADDPGGCGTIAPPRDEAAAEQLETSWRGKIAAAAQEVGRKLADGKLKGDLPGSLQRWIDSVLHPKLRWQDLLRAFVSETLRAKHENDWGRPSRRGLAAGLYLPGKKGERLGHILVHVDCSGSTWDVIPEFAAELASILECSPTKVTVIYGDTEIKGEPVEWTPDDGPFRMEQRGGGGTDHHHLASFINSYDGGSDGDAGEIVAVIGLTDGFTNWPPDYGIPTLWAITPNGDTDVPFGRVVKIEG